MHYFTSLRADYILPTIYCQRIEYYSYFFLCNIGFSPWFQQSSKKIRFLFLNSFRPTRRPFTVYWGRFANEWFGVDMRNGKIDHETLPPYKS